MMNVRSASGDKYNLRIISLVVLCVQNSGVVLLMNHVRQRPGDRFFATTAVIMSEMLKVIICLAAVSVEIRSLSGLVNHLKENILHDPYDFLKVSVPSLIYVIQNNLLYIALSNLDAATFQVMYQLKILTTALFYVAMLGKKLSKIQWLSLVLLFIGVSIVQFNQSSSTPPKAGSTTAVKQPIIGVCAVVTGSIMSGFAGVYFEKILKGTSKSIWIRNIQLGVLGVVLGFIMVFFKDKQGVQVKGFFFGYDYLVWMVIFIQSFGGLTVAVVVKYADNILKGFASSIAILLSCIGSYYFLNFNLTGSFAVGALFVMVSVMLYNVFIYKPPDSSSLNEIK